MSAIKCFLLKRTGAERLSLRRYSDGKCPSSHQYHDARRHLVDLPEGHNTQKPDKTDPRWPVKCDRCDYVFQDTDQWQLFNEALFVGNGLVTELQNAPPGAMWLADWLPAAFGSEPFKALPEDVRKLGHLVVRLPGGHDWDVDTKASNGNGWTRTGLPPVVTALPSILTPNYHGFLTNGELISC